MHRLIHDHLEEILAGTVPAELRQSVEHHLSACQRCKTSVVRMREQGAQIRETWKAPREYEPRPGFYARVMERIESEGPGSIWTLVFESPFGRRIAFASLTLAVLLGAYLVSSEEMENHASRATQQIQWIQGEDQPGLVLAQGGQPSNDAVLVNLVTYGGQ